MCHSSYSSFSKYEFCYVYVVLCVLTLSKNSIVVFNYATNPLSYRGRDDINRVSSL